MNSLHILIKSISVIFYIQIGLFFHSQWNRCTWFLKNYWIIPFPLSPSIKKNCWVSGKFYFRKYLKIDTKCLSFLFVTLIRDRPFNGGGVCFFTPIQNIFFHTKQEPNMFTWKSVQKFSWITVSRVILFASCIFQDNLFFL
jgi:hypothetical protein